MTRLHVVQLAVWDPYDACGTTHQVWAYVGPFDDGQATIDVLEKALRVFTNDQVEVVETRRTKTPAHTPPAWEQLTFDHV